MATKKKSKTKRKKKVTRTNYGYRSHVLQNDEPFQHRLMIGIPTTGNIRIEFMMARYGQAIPPNWSVVDLVQYLDTYAPVGFMVADARNCVVQEVINKDMEWLLFIDHDVILPPDAFIKMNQYMREDKHPIVSGLYYTKSNPSDPLVYRGRGNSHYDKWKLGDKFFVDGIPMGITLINAKILKLMYEESAEYRVGSTTVREVFETPAAIYQDPEQMTGMYQIHGTEDLKWCTRVMEGKYLARAGYPEHQKMKYPFLMDTSIFCRHVDQNGIQYPQQWPEMQKQLAERVLAEEKKK